MESSNLGHHHHQLHDHHHNHTHLLVSSSSSLAPSSPSCFGHAQTTPLHPTSSSINLMSHVNFNPNRLQNDLSAPSLNNMAQDFGYHQYNWGCGDLGGLNNNNNNNNNNHSAGHDYGSSSSSSDSYPKFTELLLQSSSTNSSTLGQDLNMQPTSYDHLYSSNMIFPTINVSNLNQQSTLEMNLEALDLFSCGRFAGDHHNLSNLYRSAADHSNLISSYGVIPQLQHQQSTHAPRPNSSINTSTKLSEAENFRLIDVDDHHHRHVIKRGGFMSSDDPASSSSFSEPNLMKPNDMNSLSHPPQKKSRSDSRASCPPFKVRKEKLGDRIAALQQLVAPFGKTDTASVLMEVIGYIKFLQNQIETLSVPYMKASRNKQTDRTRHQSNSEDQLDNKKEEVGRGLRSRGLCLVPLSCSSYVTTDGGGCIWPANFN